LRPLKLTVGAALTIVLCDDVLLQVPLLYVYVMLYGPPAPAVDGVNVLPLIPVPLKVPPDGEPDKVTAEALLQ